MLAHGPYWMLLWPQSERESWGCARCMQHAPCHCNASKLDSMCHVCRHHAEVLQRTADDNGWDKCGICCEALALEGDMQPRFLPCQHVLCSRCIVQCCSDGLVTCPWCREVHRPKFLVAVDGDITCAADGFPLPLMQMQYLENRVKYSRGLQA